jgi:glycosyltransferase involved in cell wall biosynthesis/tetratricopeptide (TPR) repeat protein
LGPERLVGRDDEVQALVDHLWRAHDGTAGGVIVVHGRGGVGKTALAVKVAELGQRRYLDGCLYLNLQGHRPPARPLCDVQVLDRLLRGLGVPGELVPDDLDDRVAVFRHQLANRRMLLVLDEVVDGQQVESWLPPTAGSAVVVIARERLSRLSDAFQRRIEPLSKAASMELFGSIMESDLEYQVDRHRNLLVAIASMCAGLPLAIRIVASLVKGRSSEFLEEFTRRFFSYRVGEDGTENVDAATAAVASVCSYLTEEQHRILALCAMHPGIWLDANSAAALVGGTPEEAQRQFGVLLETGMLESGSSSSYQLHVTPRDHLRSEWSEVLSNRQRRSAWTSLFDYYLRTAAAADAVIAKHRYRCPLSLQGDAKFVLDFPDVLSAMDWMAAEAPNFVPIVEEMAALGFNDICWQLAYCLRGYFFEDKQWAMLTSTYLVAAGAAQRLGDQWAEANMLNNLGLASCESGRSDVAADYYTRAREAFRAAGDQHGEMNAVANFSWLRYYEGNYEEALRLGLSALDFYRAKKIDSNAAIALDCVARAEFKLCRLDRAEAHFSEALDEFERLRFAPVHIAQVLTRLGRTKVALGNSEGAVVFYKRAVENARTATSPYDEAAALEELSSVLSVLGRADDAAIHLAAAKRLYEAVGAPDADRLRGPIANSKYVLPPATRGGIRILSVNTEWSSGHGGLSTFNRRLCGALANAGAEVICLVQTASEADHANATAAGVRLVRARHTAVGDARLPRPELPTGVTVDVVIGHGRVTGDHARQLVSDHYPTAKRFHFFHVVSDEVEFDKNNPDGDAMERAEQRTTQDLELACSASRAVAVGPWLYERLRIGMAGVTGAREPLRLDPGFDVVDGARRQPMRGRLAQILILGRLDRRGSMVKGLDLAAKAVAHAMELRESRELQIELVVRGVPVGQGDRLRERVQRWAGNPSLRVLPRPYSTDIAVMAQDLRRATLVLMPSRTEGFGLAGLEAIVAGTPVLVSGSSGLGMLLHELLPIDLADRIVVPIHRTETRDVQRWGHAIAAVLGNPPAAFQTAEMVRQIMASKRTWMMAARCLLGNVKETAY